MMRKKIISLLTITLLLFSFIGLKVYANSLGETIVEESEFLHDLPTQFVKGSEMATYVYEGEKVLDFRAYFEVHDNAVTFLDMYDREGPIDLGGYVWETNFDIDEVGVYDVTISYVGVDGYRSATVELEVIEEDTEGPTIFVASGGPGRKFNKTRVENYDDFLNEFEAYLRRARVRVYDTVDGLIQVTVDNFDEDDIEALRKADLKDVLNLVLEVEDKAGNVSSVTITLEIVDEKPPNIHNAVTITTKKGVPIDNLIGHLSFSDNYTDAEKVREDATFEVFETLVVKNIWVAGARRASQSKGDMLKHYLNLDENGLDGFVEYLETTYPTSYVIGDYYKVIVDENTTKHVVITEKELIDDLNYNVWEIVDEDTKATGTLLGELEVFDLSQTELLNHVNEKYVEGFRVDDYYRVLDLPTNNRTYYVYIKETEDTYTDLIEDGAIDFDEVGVRYVRVTAVDEYGNQSSAVFRVVITDGFSLLHTILIVNGVILGVAAIGISIFVLSRRRY